MRAAKCGHDLDTCRTKGREKEDGDRFEPLQPGLTENVDLFVISRELCRDAVTAPMWVATQEPLSVRSRQIRVESTAPHDQESGVRNLAESDSG